MLVLYFPLEDREGGSAISQDHATVFICITKCTVLDGCHSFVDIVLGIEMYLNSIYSFLY